MRLKLPSKSSTSAVQFSTQSPQFMYNMSPTSRISGRWMWPQITPDIPLLRPNWSIVSS